MRASQLQCLTYCALPYAGIGWPQSCVSILAGFVQTPLKPVLVLPRTRSSLPPGVERISALDPPLSLLPWRYVAKSSQSRLDERFAGLLDRADPATTVTYFWPGAPQYLVRKARQLGFLTIREMINTTRATAKPILDEAYTRLGLPAGHQISDESVNEEVSELGLYDLICASNAPCEVSLAQIGMESERIVRTSFGWSPSRFQTDAPSTPETVRGSGPVRALFVGSICVRKGIPALLAAWDRIEGEAELTLVGEIEPGLEQLVSKAVAGKSIKLMPFTKDVGSLYRSHDLFIFPTLEEGGPQVTIEAGGCGLPVITTPMGAGRLVRDGVNGLVVPTHAPTELAAAIDRLVSDTALRSRFARTIAADARAFTYDILGAERASAFVQALGSRQHREVASYG